MPSPRLTAGSVQAWSALIDREARLEKLRRTRHVGVRTR
jgi:hypothetical protein